MATGEGYTISVLFTPGYGPNEDRKANALQTFTNIFGGWYAMGAEVHEGLYFDFYGAQLLVSPAVKEILQSTEGHKAYHAQIHLNYS